LSSVPLSTGRPRWLVSAAALALAYSSRGVGLESMFSSLCCSWRCRDGGRTKAQNTKHTQNTKLKTQKHQHQTHNTKTKNKNTKLAINPDALDETLARIGVAVSSERRTLVRLARAWRAHGVPRCEGAPRRGDAVSIAVRARASVGVSF